MTEPLRIPAADPHPRPPRWAVGPGAWDTHAHVFGPHARYPLPADRPYTPPEQTVQDYRTLLDALGLRYGVLVQPSVYGTDHCCMLDALAAQPGRLFGVVDCDILTLPDREAARMAALGVKGLRMRWPNAGGVSRLASAAARLREIGWHLDLLPANFAAMAELAPHLRDLGLPIMVEAMGHPDPGEPFGASGFQALLGMARSGTVSVKLSHPYHIDPRGLPYAAAAPLARALVEAAPTQLVWGSDWPHPMKHDRIPNDGDLLDLLPEWAGSVEQANAILIDNPRLFYGDPES